jgi:predicted transcriptional regulator
VSKHEEIIKYIHSLRVGTKISVRSIAVGLDVSDGTAYRAIKDAEAYGIVSTIPRVGTVRIEKVEKKNIERLTFSEVVNIIEGSILGGKDGLYKTLNKFVIGAMTIDVMKKYLSPGNLLIAGNREEVHKLALENECAVLITGGFGCSEEIRNLANQKQLPIISSSYDTFTTATMINKAISENLIKKDIILVEDIMKTETIATRVYSTIGELKEIMRKSNHTKFPVLDEDDKLAGIITIKDVSNELVDNEMISAYMTKDPIYVTPKTSVAYVAHIMSWEGIDLIPVVESKKLIGIVSRQDIIKALQYVNRQPQVGETLDDIVLKNFTFTSFENGMKFVGKIQPEMLNPIGTASWNALSLIMSTTGTIALMQKNHLNVAVDSFMVFYVKPVQLDTNVIINVNIIDMGRSFSKVEIEMISEHEKELVGKALLSAKILRK